ncbi:MAG: hypothetical protein AAFN13_00455 [Bacteroidota bacterium]
MARSRKLTNGPDILAVMERLLGLVSDPQQPLGIGWANPPPPPPVS